MVIFEAAVCVARAQGFPNALTMPFLFRTKPITEEASRKTEKQAAVSIMKHIWCISPKADPQFMMSSEDTCKSRGKKRKEKKSVGIIIPLDMKKMPILLPIRW